VLGSHPPLDKTAFREGKRVAILASVQAGMALAIATGGGVAVLLCAWAWGALRRPAAPRPTELAALGEALGLLTAVLDADGRVLEATAAMRAIGAEPGQPAAGALGPDVGVLCRGAGLGLRGAAAARVHVPRRGVAQAAVVRVSQRPVRDVLLLRARWEEARPPPLPRAAPARAPAQPAGAPAPGEQAIAAGRCVLPAIERASAAAALLRLALPAGAALRELALLERALAEAERRLRVLAAADHGRPAPLDLAALVGGVVGGLPERVRAELEPAHAEVDALRVRAALREVIACALRGGPDGAVVVRAGDGEAGEGGAQVELSSAAGVGEEAMAVARALLGPEGVQVVRVGAPGQRTVCRITFPPAGAGAEGAAGRRL
jgi:hypothetical protein